MPTLPDALTSDTKRNQVIADCLELLDQEVGSKTGASGFLIKAGYKAVKGVRPSFLREAVERLLPPFAEALDPIYEEAVQKKEKPSDYFNRQKDRVAEALLSITDARAQRADRGLVRSTYERLRPMAKRNVEDAVPRVGKLIERHVP